MKLSIVPNSWAERWVARSVVLMVAWMASATVVELVVWKKEKKDDNDDDVCRYSCRERQ